MRLHLHAFAWHLLTAAALAGHAHVVKFLLQTGELDPSTPTNSGNTPLHLACQVGRRGI